MLIGKNMYHWFPILTAHLCLLERLKNTNSQTTPHAKKKNQCLWVWGSGIVFLCWFVYLEQSVAQTEVQ